MSYRPSLPGCAASNSLRCLPFRLVDVHWRVKVSDFNLSKILEDTLLLSSAQATNPRWLAPEVLAGASATMCSVSR